MLEFMTGVEATSNVLKISMTEAAQLMSTAMSPDQTGLLALLEQGQQDNVKTAMEQFQAMGVNLDNSKLMNTLVGMLTAGSRDEFMLTEQGQGMLGNAFDLATLDFVSSLLPTFQTGTKEESNALFLESLKPFVDSQIAMGQDLKTIVLGDTNIQTDLGTLIKLPPLIANMNKGIESVGGGEHIALLSEEIQRKGMQRFETAETYKLDSYMQNLYDTTIKLSESQIESMNKTIAASDNVSAIAANIGSLWEQLWLHVGIKINRAITGTLNLRDNVEALLTGDWENMNWITDDDTKAILEKLPDFKNFTEYSTQDKDSLAKHLAGLTELQNEVNKNYTKKFTEIDSGKDDSAENKEQYADLYIQQKIVAKAIAEITALLQSLNNP